MHVLLIKTSSLGDLIHALPALTDAQAACPDVRFDWVAERSFAEIPDWHPAVENTIGCELRAWLRKPLSAQARAGRRALRSRLRTHRYDLALDAQGLLKSAWLARQAGCPIAGADWHSVREPLASLVYARRYPVPPHTHTHAIERNRRLFAQALDYDLPATPPDAGLDRARFPAPTRTRPYVLLLHGTTWETKCWPQAEWIVLSRWLAARGLDVLLPWGNEAEQQQATRIAADGRGQVLPRQGLTAMAGWLAHARAFVGVDTGLSHLGAALGTPGVTLYGPTLPHLTGALGANQTLLSSGQYARIDRKRPTTVSQDRVRAAVEAIL